MAVPAEFAGVLPAERFINNLEINSIAPGLPRTNAQGLSHGEPCAYRLRGPNTGQQLEVASPRPRWTCGHAAKNEGDARCATLWWRQAFADQATIEQDFHDEKEVWDAGQQQVRNIWCNVAGLSFEPLDAFVGGVLVLGPWPKRAMRSESVAVGRRRSPSVAYGASQGLVAKRHGTRNIDACRRSAAATANLPVNQTSYGLGHVR